MSAAGGAVHRSPCRVSDHRAAETRNVEMIQPSERATHSSDAPDSSDGQRTLHVLALLGVVLVVSLAHWNAFGGPWLSWDDEPALLATTEWRGLGGSQLAWMWTTTHASIYRPLTWMSYALDFRRVGLDANGYHLTNGLLHVLNVVLVFELARGLAAFLEWADANRRIVFAALAALLFGLHPTRVEAVSWISARADLLSATFALATVLTFLPSVSRPAAVPRRQVWWRLASLFCFVLTLAAKQAAIGLPLVLGLLLLLERADRRRSAVQIARLVAPYVLVALAFLPLTIISKTDALAVITGSRTLLSAALAAHSLVFHVGLLVWPLHLSPFYELPPVVRVADVRYVVSGVLLLTAIVILVRHRAVLSRVAVIAAMYVVLLLPVSGLMPYGFQYGADRYTYIAGLPITMGMALLVTAGIGRAWTAGPRVRAVAGVAATAALLLVCAVLTRQYGSLWRHEGALWAHAVAVRPASRTARENLSLQLTAQQRFDEALHQLERDDALHTPTPKSVANRIGLLVQLGRDADAATLRTRLPRDSARPGEHFRLLGNAFLAAGRSDLAVDAYREAVTDGGETADIYNALGVALVHNKAHHEATQWFDRAIATDSMDFELWHNSALALAAAGHVEESLARHARAAALAPRNVAVLTDWGEALAGVGRFAEARAAYRRALASDPTNLRTLHNAAVAAFAAGDDASAERSLRRVLELAPAYPGAVHNLRAVLERRHGRE